MRSIRQKILIINIRYAQKNTLFYGNTHFSSFFSKILFLFQMWKANFFLFWIQANHLPSYDAQMATVNSPKKQLILLNIFASECT